MLKQERIKQILDLLYGEATTLEEFMTRNKEDADRLAEDIKAMLEELEFCIGKKMSNEDER